MHRLYRKKRKYRIIIHQRLCSEKKIAGERRHANSWPTGYTQEGEGAEKNQSQIIEIEPVHIGVILLESDLAVEIVGYWARRS